MDQKTIDMVNRIMDTGRMGYAYVYPRYGNTREEYLVATTPENIASFIGSHSHDIHRIAVTDIADRLILDTLGEYIAHCPNMALCDEVVRHLKPIRSGAKEAGEVLQIDKRLSDEYFAAEDRAVTMAEYSMELG